MAVRGLTPTVSSGGEGETPPLSIFEEFTEDQLRELLEEEYRDVAAWWDRSLQRWARRRWGPATRRVDPRKVWGMLVSAATAAHLAHEKEYAEFLAKKENLEAKLKDA